MSDDDPEAIIAGTPAPAVARIEWRERQRVAEQLRTLANSYADFGQRSAAVALHAFADEIAKQKSGAP